MLPAIDLIALFADAGIAATALLIRCFSLLLPDTAFADYLLADVCMLLRARYYTPLFRCCYADFRLSSFRDACFRHFSQRLLPLMPAALFRRRYMSLPLLPLPYAAAIACCC